MNQASLGLGNSTKRTRKREFLMEMERVVPWQALVALVAPYAPEGRRGRPPFSVETMLRIHFMQQWFGYAGRCCDGRSAARGAIASALRGLGGGARGCPTKPRS